MGSKDRRWAESFQWICDGHNLIFSDPELQKMQLGGERRKARESLESWLEKFARAIGRVVWVVYDGRPLGPQTGAPLQPSSSFVHVFYSEPSEEADDRICRLVEECRNLGRPPVVVSSDRRTLEPRITGQSEVLSVKEFGRVYGRAVGQPEKWVSGGMEDIEQHFLRGSPFAADQDAAESGEKREDLDPD